MLDPTITACVNFLQVSNISDWFVNDEYILVSKGEKTCIFGLKDEVPLKYKSIFKHHFTYYQLTDVQDFALNVDFHLNGFHARALNPPLD